MDLVYEAKYHEIEAHTWWFKTRRERVVDILRKQTRNSRILDVGCSSGMLLSDLQALGFSEFTGIDVSEKAVALAKSRGFADCHVMDGQAPAFAKNSFDIIISSDSLEHMENDKRALANWYELLKPGGMLVVFVPAYNFLWSNHDIINHHYRRYTRSGLKSALTGAGFETKRSGYWNVLLFFPAAAIRLVQKLRPAKSEPKDDMHRIPAILDWLLASTIRVENSLGVFISFPVGLSTYCIATKP